VITETPEFGPEEPEPFGLVRVPGLWKRWQLVRYHDVIHSNGASVRLYYLSKLAGKPFSWTHTAHQIQCLDGLGVVDGEISPIKPWPSVWYHIRRFGLLIGLRGGLILLNRRWIAQEVQANVEITEFMARRHDIPRKVVIHNPFDVAQFQTDDVEAAVARVHEYRHRFLYLGRLSSEKGIDILLRAFRQLRDRLEPEEAAQLNLRIIGEGPYRTYLENLALELGISSQVEWSGTQTGAALLLEIQSCGIAVVPSITPEPLGIVALELMSAGKAMIVSADTGLSECVGEAGLCVERGHVGAFAAAMERMYREPSLRESSVRLALERVRQFDPAVSVQKYRRLFDSFVTRGGR
jgi:glycosyltransferase involved in cell wall biosynthesis